MRRSKQFLWERNPWIDDIRHKIDGIIATDKKIREHDEYYVGSLRDNIISYELVQRVE